MCNLENRSEFESKLKELYSGAVVPLTDYVNNHSTMVFKCNSCHVSFFGKPSLMVGQEHQQHACNKPYGESSGARLGKVSSNNKPRKGKSNIKNTIKQLDQLLEEGVQPKSVARQLELNYVLILHYINVKEEIRQAKEQAEHGKEVAQ